MGQCLNKNTTANTDMLQFQCFSDIHIEFRHGNKEEYMVQHRHPDGTAAGTEIRPNKQRFVIPQRRTPYLALLGDIGTHGIPFDCGLPDLVEFIEECCSVFDQVWYVPGNHEGYGGSYDGVVQALQAVEAQLGRNRFALLDCSTLDVPKSNIRVLGCTLWTYVEPEHREQVRNVLNDFNRVADMTIERYVAEHDKCVKWLEQECIKATEEGKRIIILTHHAPTIHGSWPEGDMHARYFEMILGVGCSDLVRDSPPEQAEARDVHDDPDCPAPSSTDDTHPPLSPQPLSAHRPVFNTALFPGLVMWCFGHTHWNMDATQCGVRLVTNQVCYPNDAYAKNDRFIAHDMDKVLCVDVNGKTTPESVESQAKRMKKLRVE